MRKFALLAGIIGCCSVSTTISAQDQAAVNFVPNLLEECVSSNLSQSDHRYTQCFDVPDGQFYARGFVYFSLENTDLNSLIQNSAERRTFRNALASILINKQDTAYFVLRVTARNVAGQTVTMGTYPLLSVTRSGSRNYELNRIEMMSRLPAQFLADSTSRVDFQIGVLLEREAESHIARLIGTVARFAGVAVPLPGQVSLTADQELLRQADTEISRLMSFNNDFGTLVPIGFDDGDLQAYETTAALAKYLPEGAEARLIIAAYAQDSVFPSAAGLVGRQTSELAAPGGQLAGDILGTRLEGQPISARLATELGASVYNALRYGNSPQDFIAGCQQLENYLDNGGLLLTASDNDRVQWALMASNAIFSDRTVRANPCLATKAANWASLGLGSPSVAEARLPDQYWLVFDHARTEAETAWRTVAQAVDARDLARMNAEAAGRGADGFLLGNLASFYSYAGETPQRGIVATGVLTELASSRAGNLYEGEFVQSDSELLFQGYGQYTSQNAADGIGFKEYAGSFDGNFGTGHGRITYHDGSIYSGETSREKPNGFGTLTRPDGTTLYASFVDGTPRGLAVRVDSAGRKVGGEIQLGGGFRPVNE